MNKKGLILVTLFFLLATGSLCSQGYSSALGVRVSSKDAVVNHSITYKQFIGSKGVAFEGLLSFGDPVALGLLIAQHKPTLTRALTWYYGGGAFVGFSKSSAFGLQGVLGLDLKVPGIPFNISLDWKPELILTRPATFEPAAIGASFRFVFR